MKGVWGENGKKDRKELYDRERMNDRIAILKCRSRSGKPCDVPNLKGQGDKGCSMENLGKWAEALGENGFRLPGGCGRCREGERKVREILRLCGKRDGKAGNRKFSCDIKPLCCCMGRGSLKGGCERIVLGLYRMEKASKAGGQKPKGNYYGIAQSPGQRELIQEGRTTGRRGDFCKGYGEPARQLLRPEDFCR